MIATDTLLDRAKSAIPGACFGYTRVPDEELFVASHGVGSRLFSTNGSEYVDYTLGSGPLLVGHAHPRVTEAITRQAQKGTHFYAMNEPAIDLAEKIIGSTPGAEAVKFCADGSQATFFAMRIARAHTRRNKILKFVGAYHGHHDYALPAFPGKPGESGVAGADYLGIPPGATDDIVVAEYNNLEDARAVATKYQSEIAAIIVEPVQRALTPTAGFLQGLRDLTTEIGALLIFDEVVTGFRVARGGAQELYNVTADVVAYGKAVGGGTAVGAIATRRELIEYLVPPSPGAVQQVFMSGTLNGNPLGAAAGFALLEELEVSDGREKMATHVSEASDGIRNLARTKGIAVDIIGPSQFFDVLFAPRGPVTNLESYLQSDRAAAFTFGEELLKRGIYVVPGGKFYVSSVHNSSDIDRLLTAADVALDVVAERHAVTK